MNMNMNMNITENIGLKILLVLLPLLVPGHQSLHAQTSRNEVIDEVVVVDSEDCSVIRVSFNLPVKYKSHFPVEVGRELRIALAPVAVTPEDRDLVATNENLSPPDSDIAGVSEMIYEGRDVVDPYLNILFEHPVRFGVEQGVDFRSLVISVYLPGAKEECKQ